MTDGPARRLALFLADPTSLDGVPCWATLPSPEPPVHVEREPRPRGDTDPTGG